MATTAQHEALYEDALTALSGDLDSQVRTDATALYQRRAARLWARVAVMEARAALDNARDRAQDLHGPGVPAELHQAERALQLAGVAVYPASRSDVEPISLSDLRAAAERFETLARTAAGRLA